MKWQRVTALLSIDNYPSLIKTHRVHKGLGLYPNRSLVLHCLPEHIACQPSRRGRNKAWTTRVVVSKFKMQCTGLRHHNSPSNSSYGPVQQRRRERQQHSVSVAQVLFKIQELLLPYFPAMSGAFLITSTIPTESMPQRCNPSCEVDIHLCTAASPIWLSCCKFYFLLREQYVPLCSTVVVRRGARSDRCNVRQPLNIPWKGVLI